MPNPITRSIEVITEADVDVATAEAQSTIDEHCPVQSVKHHATAEHNIIIVTALYANEVEVAQKVNEVRRAVARYGRTDVRIVEG